MIRDLGTAAALISALIAGLLLMGKVYETRRLELPQRSIQWEESYEPRSCPDTGVE